MVVPRNRLNLAEETNALRVWIRDYKNAGKLKHLKCRIDDKFLVTAEGGPSLPGILLEKQALLGVGRTGPRWASKKHIDPGQ